MAKPLILERRSIFQAPSTELEPDEPLRMKPLWSVIVVAWIMANCVTALLWLAVVVRP